MKQYTLRAEIVTVCEADTFPSEEAATAKLTEVLNLALFLTDGGDHPGESLNVELIAVEEVEELGVTGAA